MTAWEAHSLSLLTEGRFEMGIGTGRPGIEDELRDKGMPAPPPPNERLAQVRETVRTLRDLDGPDLHTPECLTVSALPLCEHKERHPQRHSDGRNYLDLAAGQHRRTRHRRLRSATGRFLEPGHPGSSKQVDQDINWDNSERYD
jgi:alkanesulfonate monooxygenase SsuD/methylene tetrahydromethanopterin reductase-like flavin-dependent oxidoreductase (luciferase family)